MNRKEEIIIKLGKMSPTRYHEYVAEMLEYYGLYGTCELTEEQAEAFLKKKEGEIYAGITGRSESKDTD